MQQQLQINHQLEIQKEFLSKYKKLLLLLLQNIEEEADFENQNFENDNINTKEVIEEEDYVEVGGAD